MSRVLNEESRRWISDLLALTILSVVLAFGSLRDLDYADSYLPIYCSLQKWTPFCWAQNRWGMLVPGLASIVRDPAQNLFFQNLLSSLGLIGASLMLPYCLGRGDIARPWAGWTLLFLLVCVNQAALAGVAAAYYPFGFSLLLFCSGWLLCNSRRWAAGTISYLLAFWINIGLGPLTVLLVVCDGWRRGRPLRQLALQAGIPAAIFLLWTLICAHLPYHDPRQTQLRIPSPEALSRLLANVSASIHWPVLLAFGAGSVWTGRKRPLSSWWKGPSFPLLAGALFLVGIFLLMLWAELNDFSPRYMYHSFWLLGAALALPLAEARWPLSSSWLSAVLGCLLLGFQTPQNWVRQHLGAPHGALLAELQQNRVQVLGGDYWTTWTLSYTSWCLRQPELVSIAYRSDPLLPRYRERILQGATIATQPLFWLDLMKRCSWAELDPSQLRSLGRTRSFLLLARDGRLSPDSPANLPELNRALAGPESLAPYLGQGWVQDPQRGLATFYTGELIFRKPPGCRSLSCSFAAFDPQQTRLQVVQDGKPLTPELSKQERGTSLRLPLSALADGSTGSVQISASNPRTGEPLQLFLQSLEFTSTRPNR